MLTVVFTPETAGSERKADKAYEFYRAGEYFEALDHFKNAYSKSKDKTIKAEMVFMVAECYRLINDPRNAETWYKKAIRSAYSKPEAQYWYADAVKKNGTIPAGIGRV